MSFFLGHLSRDRLVTLLIILLLMAAALALRFPGLVDYHFSADDSMHVLRARAPTLDALLHEWDTHPPLYYLLLRWLLVVVPPARPLVPKLLALGCGVALVPAAYLLGRIVSNERAGGLALALLATFSGQLVLQSQAVRHYTLLALLEMLLLLAFLSRRRGVAYFVPAALCVTTHYAAALLIAATGLAGVLEHLQERAGTRRIAGWLAGHLLVMALWAWTFTLVPGSVGNLHGWMHRGYLFQHTLAGREHLWPSLCYVLSRVHMDLEGPGSGSLLLLLAIGTAGEVWRRAHSLLLIAYLPLLLTLVLSALGRYPMGENRYCLWLVPATLLPLAAAPCGLRRWLGRAAGPAVMLAVATLMAINLAGSPHHGVLQPDLWRRRASGFTPTVAEHLRQQQELAVLSKPGSVFFAPYGPRLRAQVDAALGWAAPGGTPMLTSCPGLNWETFTPESLRSCLRSYTGPLKGEVWFISMHIDGTQRSGAPSIDGSRRDEDDDDDVSTLCLPIWSTRRVGRIDLVAVDRAALQEAWPGARCWKP